MKSVPSLPLLLCAAVFVTAAGCGRKPESAATAALPTASVRVQTVASTRQPGIEEVMGTVQAKLRATIEAKVSGRIEDLPVSLGQSVKAGDLLAQLDVKEIQAKLDQANASFVQAERDYRRASVLLPEQAMTQAEFDAAQARYRTTKAAVAEAKSMLNYARVLAPFDGVITRKPADVGDMAMPGKPLLEMENPNALRFVAAVPDAISGHIRLGASLKVRIDSHPGEVTGKVSEIAPAAEPASHTVEVKLDLPPTPGLRSGQFGRLAVPLADTATIQVPTQAVIRRGQMELVFVVKQGVARLRLVRTGRQADGRIELLSGVSPGEQIVVQGAEELLDGQPVEAK